MSFSKVVPLKHLMRDASPEDQVCLVSETNEQPDDLAALQEAIGLTAVQPLIPSGGDDGPAMVAMAEANRGLVLLGPGEFLINSPIILESQVMHYGNFDFGVQLIGQGAGVTVVNTSACNAPQYTKIDVTNFAHTAGWNTITMTNAEAAKLAVGDVIRSEVATGMIEANGFDWTVSTITDAGGGNSTVQVSSRQGVSVFGMVAWANSTHNFFKKYNSAAEPVIRFQGHLIDGYGRSHNMCSSYIKGIKFKGRNILDGTVKRTQRMLAFQPEELYYAAGKGVTHFARVSNCVFTDYECGIHAFDTTSLLVDNCEFRNTSAGIWPGYNFDIVKILNCGFGQNTATSPNQALDIGVHEVPKALKFNGTTEESANANNVEFDSCWFLPVSACFRFDSLSGPTTLRNCYLEQIRYIGDFVGQVGLIDACHFSTYSDASYTRPMIGASGNAVRLRLKISNCYGSTNLGPEKGYLNLLPSTTAEKYWPMVTLENNQFFAESGKGLAVGSSYIGFSEDHGSTGSASPQAAWSGHYVFEGPFQIQGTERITQHTSAAGAVTPDFLTGTTKWITALQEATTIGALANMPTVPSGNYAQLRSMPIRFIIKQDGTGGRNVSWNAAWKFRTPFSNTGNTANTTTEVEFRWDGTNWVSNGGNVWL